MAPHQSAVAACDERPHIVPMQARNALASGSPSEHGRAGHETGPWRRLLRGVGRLPFVVELVAAWYCALDRATPLRVRLLLFGAFAYLVVPVDLIPDVVILLGITDDVALLWAALRAARPHITEAHRARARSLFGLTP
jgi:uncharacterized membrane protein YkvA (DUF1232 family)